MQNKVYNRFLPAWVLLWLSGDPLHAQVNYVASEIPTESPFVSLRFEDLNGDGRQDLVYSHWRRGIGRELLIHYQTDTGRFDASPTRVEIKREIIGVGFADLRPAPGKELVLFASNGIFSLSAAIEGYAGNLVPLLDWKLVADIPDPEQVEFFGGIEDITGDGLVDLVVPGEYNYGVFRAVGPEQFELVSEFSTINRDLNPALRPRGDAGLSASLDINSRDGIRLQVSARQPTPFAGFIENWQADAVAADTLLEAENWMPSALLADFNGDDRPDIVFLNVGNDLRGQINLLFQRADGGFPSTPDWQGSVDTRGDLRLVELDGDGLMDLARLSGEGDEWTISFFLNRAGSFALDSPDQVMRFSGYDVDFEAIDLDVDGRPELAVSYYTIPVVEAIRNTGIVRSQLLFDNDTDGLFVRRPQFRLDETFSASNVRGLAERMSLEYDVDGDGRPDALSISAEGTVVARRIDNDLRIVSDPFWQYVPPRIVIDFEVKDLNQDKIPDLVLRHSSSFTILVSSQ
jgi:hypothetical protein